MRAEARLRTDAVRYVSVRPGCGGARGARRGTDGEGGSGALTVPSGSLGADLPFQDACSRWQSSSAAPATMGDPPATPAAAAPGYGNPALIPVHFVAHGRSHDYCLPPRLFVFRYVCR
jgi:hypothetical protein